MRSSTERQITYNLFDTETGEVRGGRICPADRAVCATRSSAASPARRRRRRSAGASWWKSCRRWVPRCIPTGHLGKPLLVGGCGVVGPARAHPGAALEGAAARYAGRAALGVATANPGAALRPGVPRRRQLLTPRGASTPSAAQTPALRESACRGCLGGPFRSPGQATQRQVTNSRVR